MVEYIAKQVHVNSKAFSEYDWAGRAIKYHRAEIRDFCGFREATVEDFNSLMSWLVENVLRVAETPRTYQVYIDVHFLLSARLGNHR